MSGSSNVAAMKKVVQQLRLEASVTRVKVSAEPRRDGTGRTRRHFTAPGPRPPRWGRAGAAGSDLPCPALPRPADPLGGGARASPGTLSGFPGRGEPGAAAQPRPPRPCPRLGRSPPPPFGPRAAPRPKRSPGRWTRPALPVRAPAARSALLGLWERPPEPGRTTGWAGPSTARWRCRCREHRVH